jgi:hypothetical protein
MKVKSLLPNHKLKNKNYYPSYTITDSYKLYKGPMSKKVYIKVLKDFFWELSLIMIRKKYIFKYQNLGKFSIVKGVTSSNHKCLDYKYYNDTGKKVILTNIHTDGKKFRFKWVYKNFYKTTNLKFYTFKPVRGEDRQIGKRGLAAWIKRCSEDPRLKDY